jgi:hypothetical protein
MSSSQIVTARNANTRVLDIEGPHFLLQADPQAAARTLREFAREAM